MGHCAGRHSLPAYRQQGDKVQQGEVLFDIYSESEEKLDFAIKALEGWNPIELQKFVLSTMR